MVITLFAFIFALFPLAVLYAADEDIVITEIMYDLPDADAGREWLEIYNSGAGPVTIIGGSGNNTWRLYETHSSGPHNHTFSAEPFRGNMALAPGQYVVIAQNGETFSVDNPDFIGTILISSAFSLVNTGQTLGLRIGSGGAIWSEVTYASGLGAQEDGNSLQLVGSQWIAALPTPGAPNSGKIQQSSSSSEESSSAPTPAGGSSAATQPKVAIVFPSLKADAGGDRTAVAGSLVEFIGNALGLKDEPLENARFWWNLGDGETKEGKAISHSFRVPGNYTVGLHVSSGLYAASDYLLVKVVPNQLRIAGVIPGEAGFIKIANPGKTEVDLGGWILESGGKQFVIPWKTKAAAEAEIAFANPTTGLLSFASSPVSILYPNGMVATRWDFAKEIQLELGVIEKTANVQMSPGEKSEAKEIVTEKGAEVEVKKNGLAQVSDSASLPSWLFLVAAGALSLAAAIAYLALKRFGLWL